MKALIVDGYNALHKIPHIRISADKSLKDARKALTELALDYQRKTGGIAEVYVVFDGRDSYRSQSLSADPHQIFSKTGEGDRTIVRMVGKLSRRYHVVVASDDNFVRNNSRAHNASIITVAELFLRARKGASKDRRGMAEEKRISPKDEEEITEYLKKGLEQKSSK